MQNNKFIMSQGYLLYSHLISVLLIQKQKMITPLVFHLIIINTMTVMHSGINVDLLL